MWVKVHRVFPSRHLVYRVHLHTHFDFMVTASETVERLLRHSCRSVIIWQGVSLPLDRQVYGRRSCSVKSWPLKVKSLHVTDWTGVRQFKKVNLRSLSCVFVKQSAFNKEVQYWTNLCPEVTGLIAEFLWGWIYRPVSTRLFTFVGMVRFNHQWIFLSDRITDTHEPKVTTILVASSFTQTFILTCRLHSK